MSHRTGLSPTWILERDIRGQILGDKKPGVLAALLRILPSESSSRHNCLAIVQHNWPTIKKELAQMARRAEWNEISAVRRRLRPLIELCGYYEEGVELGKSWLETAEAVGEETRQEQAWILTKDLGWMLVMNHEYEEAIGVIEKAVEVFDGLAESEDKAQGRFYCLRYLAVAHMRSNYEEELENSKVRELFGLASKEIPKCPERKREQLRGRLENNYGTLALLSNELDHAEKHFDASREIFLKLRNKEHRAIALINLGKVGLKRLENMTKSATYIEHVRRTVWSKKAEENLLEGLQAASELGWVEGQGRAHEFLGKLYRTLDEPLQGLEHARIACSTYKQLKQQSNIEGACGLRDTLRESKTQPYAFLSMAFREDDEAYSLDHAATKICGRAGLKLRRIDRDSNPSEELSLQIRNYLKKAHVIIADLTHERPNVYYEIGFAHSLDLPTILTARKKTSVHFNIHNFNIVFYENANELETKLSQELARLGFGPEYQ